MSELNFICHILDMHKPQDLFIAHDFLAQEVSLGMLNKFIFFTHRFHVIILFTDFD
jgi:hypothetical protein